MTTRLEKPLKREITLDGVPYIVTLSPEGLKIVVKGKRKGQELTWGDLVSGKAAFTQALKDSIGIAEEQELDR
jgi:hypothetical protein